MLKSLLIVGIGSFCEGFTTYSTFAHESMQMLHNGNMSSFIGYVALSITLGVVLIAAGYWIVK